MAQNKHFDGGEMIVCGQAHAVSDILSRTGSLPTELSLTIEEILERAWEIAYRKGNQPKMASITDLGQFRAMRRAEGHLPHSG